MIRFKIKTKLSLGLGFLFAVILLVGSVSAIYINEIANSSKRILRDNYESIEYSKIMLRSIDDIFTNNPKAVNNFERNLKLQENNITEKGEKNITMVVRKEFNEIKRHGNSLEHINIMKNALFRITDLNMQAILKKNDEAQIKADRLLFYLGVIGCICFLVVFTFIIRFPGYIANPVNELTQSIKSISEKNYNQRLHFKSNDEFGELADAFNSMAEKLEHYENSNLAKIMFEKKRIETIINNMTDAIIGVNESRIILFVNRQAEQLLGLKEADIIGKYAPDVAITNDLMRLLFDATNETSKPIKIYADGKESYFNRENISILSEEKSIGKVILLKNITKFQELDLAKTNFIATISHELKTPIASIKLSSKLLDDIRVGDLNKEQKQLVHNINDDAERLLKITSEVLNMAQVETGNIQLSIQQSDPVGILNYALEAVKVQAEQKKIELVLKTIDKLPFVKADAEKTSWVLINLLTNAIRYSEASSKIVIDAKRSANSVVFSVKDFGKGIEAKYTGKIFDRYFQIPGSSKSGTGLGLSISKEFIEAQGGTIKVESEFGVGTTFLVTLNGV